MADEMERLDEEVAKVEEEFIAAGKMFTALDIGNELKNRGVNVRQRAVSPIVRRHFSEGDAYSKASYTRALISVKGGAAQAFLYFSIARQPEEYTATVQDSLPWEPAKPMFSAAAQGTAPPDISNVVSVAGAASHQCYVGSRRGRVYHSSGCCYAARIKAENRLDLSTDSLGRRKCARE